MSLIQIFIVCFSLFAVTRVLRQFRQGAITIAWMIVWSVFWLFVGGVVLSPQTTDTLARLVGVGRGVDFMIYSSIVALFYLAFRLFVKMEDLEREITRLVRKMGMEEAEALLHKSTQSTTSDSESV